MKIEKRVYLILALILLVSGFNVIFFTSHTWEGMRPSGIAVGGLLLFFAGAVMLLFHYRAGALSRELGEEYDEEYDDDYDEVFDEKDDEVTYPDEKRRKRDATIAEKLIRFFTIGGRLIPYLPIIGAALISADIYFNRASGNFHIATFDYVVIFLGLVMIAYPYIPRKFSKEKNLALLFFVLLMLLLVLPLTMLAQANGGDTDENVNSQYVRYLLSEPAARFVSIFGTDANAHSVFPDDIGPAGFYFPEKGVWESQNSVNNSGEFIVFQNSGGEWMIVQIGLSCTGLYSVTIFVSLFISYIFVEYTKISRKVGVLLGLGILTAWFANLLRISIIIIAGANYGGEALEWAHRNVGEIIFITWVMLFWVVLFKYLDPQQQPAKKIEPENNIERKETV